MSKSVAVVGGCSWTEIRVSLWLGLLVCATNSSAQSFTLQSSWHLSPGDRPYLTAGTTLERGLAYHPQSDQVLLVSRVNSPTIRRLAILNAADGSDAGELDTNDLSGGTFVLSKIAVADDGAIYAGNFGTYSSGNPFKVYRWANPTAAPTSAFSGDPGLGNTQQWGNAWDVRGNGENTQILLASAGNIVALLTTTNGTNFVSRVLSTDAPAGAFYHGIAFGPGQTFWGKTNSGPLREMEFNLQANTATTRRIFSGTNFPGSIASLAVDPATGLLAGISLGTPDTLMLFDISHPTIPPQLLDAVDWPTDNANTLSQGALDFYHGGKLFALNANNGISAFHIVPPTALTATTSGQGVTLAWSQRLSNTVVQSSATLTSGAWTNRIATPQLSSGELRVTLPKLATAEFYRLQRPVRVMSFNIQHGEGADGLINLPRIADVVRAAGAEVVALQEVDQATTRSGGVDQAAELGRLLGMNHYFGRSINYQGGGYGNAVLSRYPIRQQKRTLLARLNASVEQRSVAEVVLDLGGAELVLLNTHLDAGAADDERLHSIAQLKILSQRYGQRPMLLCGDFNSISTEPTYAALAEDFADAWAAVGVGNGYTFPSQIPNRRIDYFWYLPNGQPPIRAWVPVTTASDHRPLVTDWLLTPSQ